MHEDSPHRSNQQGAAGKEDVRDPKSKNQRSERFADTAAKGKGKNLHTFLSAKNYNWTLNLRKAMPPSPWFSSVRRCRSTTGR